MKNKKYLNVLPLAFRKSAAFLLTASISISLVFTGCASSKTGKQPQGEISSEQTEQSYAAKEAFAQFTDEIFRENTAKSLIDLHYTLANPENIGIGAAKSPYGEISLAIMQEETEMVKGYLDRLSAIHRENLTPEDQLDYDILKNYLETEFSCAGLEAYAQPLAPTIGIQAQLPILLAEYNFYQPKDIEDYFLLLAELDNYFGQILQLEQEKAEQGLMITDKAIDRILDSCQPYLESGENSLLHGTFVERLENLQKNSSFSLTEEEKASYIQRHQDLIASSFVPAYQHLIEGLENLKGTGQTEGGLCQYPHGKEYYRYLVYSSTFTSCKNVDTLRKIIEKRMDEDFEEMRQLLAKEPDLLDQVTNMAFSLTDPAEILACLQKEIQHDYPEPICQDYSLHYVPKALEPVLSPAFYLTSPIDRPDINTIYINQGSTSATDQLFTTLAHEGYPGHLYQTAYFIQQNPKPFRHLLSFSAYKEGWATYVEFDAYHLDKTISPSLAKILALNSSVNLGIHAYLDVMVNDQGWGLSEVSSYVGKYFSDPEQTLSQALLETMIDNPSNYLEYYVGYLEFSDMRKKTEQALGDRFEAKAFHQFLLDIGPAPFTIIRERLEEWIKEQKA